MPDIIDHVSYLSEEIGPRPGGTEEEQQAALYIADYLQKEAGLAVAHLCRHLARCSGFGPCGSRYWDSRILPCSGKRGPYARRIAWQAGSLSHAR